MFIKALIFRHFDLKCYIQIVIDVLGYAIKGVLSQLTSDHLTSDQSQWHLVAYFLKKMILAETRYKSHNSKLLIIVKVFKIWYHYLEDYKHKVLVLINYNNLRQFMDIKSLNSC